MRVARRASFWFRLVRALAAAAVMAALPGLLASCASSGSGRGTAATASNASNASNGNVITLTKIDRLKSLFNRDDGLTRLVLIFSPT